MAETCPLLGLELGKQDMLEKVKIDCGVMKDDCSALEVQFQKFGETLTDYMPVF